MSFHLESSLRRRRFWIMNVFFFFLLPFLFITLDCIEQEQARRLKVGLVAIGVLYFSSSFFFLLFFFLSFAERVSNVAAAAYSRRPFNTVYNWTLLAQWYSTTSEGLETNRITRQQDDQDDDGSGGKRRRALNKGKLLKGKNKIRFFSLYFSLPLHF